MRRMCREFARCEGLIHMGLGMLIAGAFLHLVFAGTSQFVLPFFRWLLPGAAHGKLAQQTTPHFTLEPWGFVHALIIFSLVVGASYPLLKWSNRLAQNARHEPPAGRDG